VWKSSVIPGSAGYVVDGVGGGIEQVATGECEDSEQEERPCDHGIDIKGRKNPQDAATIKAGERNRARVFQLLKQQLGDEEPGNNEEDADTCLRQAQVETSDGKTYGADSMAVEDKQD
jgi:hypothetical protein